MLISSPILPSQKQWETNPSSVCKQLKKSHNHFTHRSYRSEHNKFTSRKKKVVALNVIKCFVCRPEIGLQYFDKLKPEPDLTRKFRPDWELCTMLNVSFQEFYLHNDTKIYLRLNQNAHQWIGKKVQSFTFNTKRMSNKTRCDESVKLMFRTWMKTLMHCGWVWLNSSKSDDLQTNAFNTSTKCKKKYFCKEHDARKQDFLLSLLMHLWTQHVSSNVLPCNIFSLR